MASRNEITGRVLKTDPPNSASRDGWDRIFGKKTAEEWLQMPEFAGIIILDDDGWRRDDGITINDKISYKDFDERLSVSTCNFSLKS